MDAPTFDLETIGKQQLALNEAALAISSDLALSETLKRIVMAAAKLANARYAALGVPDETGTTMLEFITTGITPDEEARISHRPRGHGVLGVIVSEGVSLRLRNVRHHPRSVGFPANHPPMTSFLGVPITHKGRRLGNIYLTDKQGAPEFTPDDQRLIELLAAHAGIAIENARLHHATLAHSRELSALNAVSFAVSQYLDLNRVLAEALEQVLAITRAEVGEIFLLNEASGDMSLALYRGPFPEAFQTLKRFKRGEGFPGQVALSGAPLVSTNLASDMRYLRRQVIEAGFTTYACLPLLAKGKVVGTLGLAAREVTTFDTANLSLLMGIGHQVGVAVENARLYEQVQQLRVLEERQRIGMDLHDGIIQSIYAVGLTLEYVGAQLADGDTPGARARLPTAIEALNATIRDIRSYILDLRPRRFEGDNLIEGLKRLLAEFKANTLMMTEFTADPLADRALTPDIRLALFHIAQEALSNAARHSRASRMDVRLIDLGADVALSLTDNGRGFDPERVEHRVGHGLSNMQERVRAFGGQISLGAGPAGSGAEIKVSLPKPIGV